MSSDEIDIEEHDVLDDPRLRHLLPGMVRVKTEAEDYDDGAENYMPFSTDAQHSSTSGFVVSHTQAHHDNDDAAEYTRHNNKIILGSKPDNNHHSAEPGIAFASNVNIKQEIPDEYGETSHDGSVYILPEPVDELNLTQVNERSDSYLNENRMVEIQNMGFFSNNIGMDQDVQEERIPENCHVSLEDWGPKLLSSSCYCRLCKILFPTRNVLDAHKMACHSLLVAVDNNKAYKSTSKNVDNMKSCAQCNKKFSNDSLLLAHVYGHLASQISKKNVPQQPIPNKFSNKISFGSKVSSDMSQPEDSESDDGVSGFYQCSVCSLYLASKDKFLMHNKENHFIPTPITSRVDYDSNCSYCSYRNKDVSMYNDHVMSIHTNLYTKKMVPTQSGTEGQTSCKYQCTKCGDILLSYTSARKHRKLVHPEDKAKKNVIKKIICKVTQPNIAKKLTVASTSQLKRKLPFDANVKDDPKKLKLDEDSTSHKKFTMYYCKACKNVSLGHRYLSLHMEGKCCPKLVRKRRICTICGLAVSTNQHKQFHETNPDATIHDIKFIRIQDRQTIDAPIPEYRFCKVCKVQGLKMCEMTHVCGKAHNFCRICKKSFLDSAYANHVEFHKYEKSSSPKSTGEIPEILKQYEMLTETWNMLYLCSVCNIVTDSYDKAVEHSQNHFNHMESYGVTIKQCHVCKLMFDDSCLERHLEIHKQNSINKDSFKILTYDFSKLLTKQWFDLFGSIPNSEIQKIVSRSVYAHCRSIKMTVFLEGAPELTLYQCSQCKLYVYPPSVEKHNELCLKSDKKFYCDLCYIPFSSARGKDTHLITHQNRGTYRHVVFNATEDKEFDQTLKSNPDKVQEARVPGLNKKNFTVKDMKGKSTIENLNEPDPNNMFVIYSCIKCKINISKRSNAKRHVCGNSKKRVGTIICNKCGLMINAAQKIHHIEKHKTNKKFTRANMKIIKFTLKKNAVGEKVMVFPKEVTQKSVTNHDVKVVNLMKCSCGLHFISPEAYANHKNICSPKLKTTKCTCSKCGYLFDTNELFRHNCKHHSSDSPVKYVVTQAEDNESNENSSNDDNLEEYEDDAEKSEKIKLYKCGSCKLFFHFKDDIVRHLSTCDPNDKKENKCNKCDIPFYLNTIKHALAVQNCEELTEDDYDVSTLYPREIISTTNEKTNKDHWLYKCWQCDLHWACEDGLKRYHYRTARHLHRSVTKCPECGLNFTGTSIKLHLFKHHTQMKLKRKDFHIETILEEPEKMAESIKSEKNNREHVNVSKTKKPSILWNMLSQKVAKTQSIINHTNRKLHKCNACQLNFLSKSTRYRHNVSGVCGTLKAVPCPVCRLLFTSITLQTHLVEHYGNVKPAFGHKKEKVPQVDTTNKTIVDLYSCSTCRIVFLSKSSLGRHIQANKHNEPRIPCSVCGLSMNSTIYQKHKTLHHERMMLSRKNFRLKTVKSRNAKAEIENGTKDQNMQFNCEDDDNLQIEKTNNVTYKKGLKNLNVGSYTRNVYKCQHCILHFMTLKAKWSHIKSGFIDSSGCRVSDMERCKICKLVFTKNSLERHMYIHHKVMKLRRGDITVKQGRFYRTKQNQENLMESPSTFTLSEQMKAQMDATQYENKLWVCNRCGRHFLTAMSRITHKITCEKKTIKTTNIVNCTTCGLAFTNVSLAKHEYIHHEKLGFKREDLIIINDGDTEKKYSTFRTYNLTEKTKGLLDITQYNNQIYSCKRCGVHFLKSQTRQRHGSLCKSKDPANATNCTVCGLKFLAPTLPKHEYIHHEKLGLKLDDLIIINDGDTEKKISTFRTYNLSEKSKGLLDITQYNHQIYKCKRCGLHFLKSQTRQRHGYGSLCRSKNPANATNCTICGLEFLATTLPKHEYVHHERLNLQLENFEIIEDTQTTPVSATSNAYTLCEKTKAGIDMTLYSKELFKCTRCGRHLLTKASRRGHERRCLNNLMNPGDIQNCQTCGLAFSGVTAVWHEHIHHENMKLNLEDFEIIDDPNDSFDTSELNETSVSDKLQTDEDNSQSKVFKYKMKAKLDLSRYSSKVYRCQRCKLHFMTYNSLRTHESKCYKDLVDPEHAVKTNCSICGLAFSPITLVKHEYIHHERLNLDRDDISITTSTRYQEKSNKQDVEIDVSKYNNKLYKCSRCERHFLTCWGMKSHVFYCDISTNPVGTCSVCGLTFAATTVPKHIVIHHEKLKLELKDFEIIENSNEPAEKESVRPTRARLTRSFYAEDSGSSLGSRASSVHNFTADSSVIDSNENERADGAASPIAKRLVEEYRHNKRVKSTTVETLIALDVNAFDNKVYKCSQCNVCYILKNTLQRHGERNDHIPACMLQTCDRCDNKFTGTQLLRHIYIHHERLQLKKEDLVIVTYDELRKTLYKCVKCETHYFEEESLSKHSCGKMHPKCIICDLKFANVGVLNIHYDKHHKKMKLSKDDMIVIDIDLGVSSTNDTKESDKLLDNIKQEIETPTEEMEVSQDEDQISQTSDEILQESESKTDDSALEINVSEMPLISDTIPKILTTHTDKLPIEVPSDTLQSNSVSDIDSQLNDEPSCLELSTLDISLYDNKLFKCTQCSLHFLAAVNLKWHLDNSDHISVRKIHCTICGLAFSAQTLPTHTFIHHEKLKLGADDFKFIYGMSSKEIPTNSDSNNDSIVTQSSDESMIEEQSSPKKASQDPIENITSSDEVVTTKKYTTKLYKCSECNVHFLSQATCTKHLYKHVPFDPLDYIACKICGLQFGNMTFPKHVIQHHKNKEFHLDQVLVEAHQPAKDNNTQKIEIYLAIDKLQSKLVSTTTEKDAPECSTSFEEKSDLDIPESSNSVADADTESNSNTQGVKNYVVATELALEIPVSTSSTESTSSLTDDAINDTKATSQEDHIAKSTSLVKDETKVVEINTETVHDIKCVEIATAPSQDNTESASPLADPDNKTTDSVKKEVEDDNVTATPVQDIPKSTISDADPKPLHFVADKVDEIVTTLKQDVSETTSSIGDPESANFMTDDVNIITATNISQSTDSVADDDLEPTSSVTDKLKDDTISTSTVDIRKSASTVANANLETTNFMADKVKDEKITTSLEQDISVAGPDIKTSSLIINEVKDGNITAIASTVVNTNIETTSSMSVKEKDDQINTPPLDIPQSAISKADPVIKTTSSIKDEIKDDKIPSATKQDIPVSTSSIANIETTSLVTKEVKDDKEATAFQDNSESINVVAAEGNLNTALEKDILNSTESTDQVKDH